MATGFKLSDGRDLSDIFSAGDAGLTVGFQTSNGADLGRQFMGGSTGVVTGYKDYAGIDLGSRFGNDPWIAQGYTPCTMLVGSLDSSKTSGGESGGDTTYFYERGFFRHRTKWYGALSDSSLIGTDNRKSCLRAFYSSNGVYSFTFYSTGSKKTSVVIGGVVLGYGYTNNSSEPVWNYLNNHAGQNITIYLK